MPLERRAQDARNRAVLKPRLHTLGYSRFVNLMKILLPLVALVLISIVLVWPYLKPVKNQFKVGISALKIKLQARMLLFLCT